MATNRIGFRPFKNRLRESPKDTAIVVDSNVIISYFDETHSQHDQVTEFLDEVDQLAGVTLYTTVTTKAEFLEYNRRRLLTDALISLTEPKFGVPIGESCRAKINTVKGRRNSRETAEKKRVLETGDLEFDTNVSYFNDKEIKEIKKAFRARDLQNETGWIKICEIFLKGKLAELEHDLDEFCVYLSPHDEKQRDLFLKPKVEWSDATRLCETAGTGYSDALILNMLLHTKVEYLLTLDFDLIYASAISAKDKAVLLPDNRIGEFKPILKGI
jgi:predicted nucleic acid-binding protein